MFYGVFQQLPICLLTQVFRGWSRQTIFLWNSFQNSYQMWNMKNKLIIAHETIFLMNHSFYFSMFMNIQIEYLKKRYFTTKSKNKKYRHVNQFYLYDSKKKYISQVFEILIIKIVDDEIFKRNYYFNIWK